MIDFHTHTNFSDGILSPTELIERAISNGVEQMAITDHDTVAGYLSIREQIEQQAEKQIERGSFTKPIQLISGVEISTVWRGIGIHIVGLNFDAEHTAITDLLNRQTEAREKRAEIIIQKLRNANMPMTLEEVCQMQNTNHVGRPHIAQVMVAKGYVNSVNAAFKKYLGAGKIGDVKSGWTNIPNAVQAIVQSGGIAVVVHPDRYNLTRTKLLTLLDEFKEAGGQGIEVISGKQHRDITEKMAYIANDKGLYASVGSDFHQPISYRADIGQLAELPNTVIPVWELFDE